MIKSSTWITAPDDCLEELRQIKAQIAREFKTPQAYFEYVQGKQIKNVAASNRPHSTVTSSAAARRAQKNAVQA
jgi:hypothetical protein